MNSNRATKLLERQQNEIAVLKGLRRASPEFKKWQRDTEIALERIFSTGSRNIDDFKKIRYTLSAFSNHTPDHKFQDRYLRGLDEAHAILASMVQEIREFDFEDEEVELAPNVLSLLEQICLRFHSVARQLRSRHDNRSTLTIEDEYDVQDLLHALLRLHFDDIRPEEHTPSYAGKSSRVDFLLKNEEIVVETKKTRASLHVGKLGEELLIDRARYEKHPNCQILVCFVYDPEGRIGNPVGLERDLEDHDGNLKVRVIVAPKS